MPRLGKARPNPAAQRTLGGPEAYAVATDALREAGVSEEDIERRDLALALYADGEEGKARTAAGRIRSSVLKRGTLAQLSWSR